MRLEPVEKPRGFVARMAYWGTKRRFGKVMTPMRVVLARMPGSFGFSNSIANFELKKVSLDPELRYLIATLTSQINGCDFCTDLGRSMAIRQSIGLKKFDALGRYRTDPMFSEKERAALSYAEEATRQRKVSDPTFEALRRNFSDREIVEITWVNAVENYYNLINIPLEIGSDGFCTLALQKNTDSAR